MTRPRHAPTKSLLKPSRRLPSPTGAKRHQKLPTNPATATGPPAHRHRSTSAMSSSFITQRARSSLGPHHHRTHCRSTEASAASGSQCQTSPTA
eukprot:14020648-Alexandrium_andersonii.AAC.1